ncbi:response regulator [Kordiimonas lipolytica]|uniref:Response regulator n=1 Tax=Kordiimonas lipolytica TaxID=1662421 RepID=A0ABV8U879_9PROT|nr:response regulator [Kordiimonas lipolytica]
MGRILVVDDDPRVRQMLQRYLSGEGFQTVLAADLRQAGQSLKEQPVSLVILDINLGSDDGLDFAREVRAADGGLPIIILSGKDDVVDRIVGLEVGADDYVTKPFHLRELLARIKTVLRRSATRRDGTRRDMTANDSAIRFGAWYLLRGSRRLLREDGAEHVLTTGEFKLLDALTRHPQRVLSRDRLLDMVAGRNWTPFDRSIDTQIRRLRSKVEENPAAPSLIKTVRGEGYMLAVRVENGVQVPGVLQG